MLEQFSFGKNIPLPFLWATETVCSYYPINYSSSVVIVHRLATAPAHMWIYSRAAPPRRGTMLNV